MVAHVAREMAQLRVSARCSADPTPAAHSPRGPAQVAHVAVPDAVVATTPGPSTAPTADDASADELAVLRAVAAEHAELDRAVRHLRERLLVADAGGDRARELAGQLARAEADAAAAREGEKRAAAEQAAAVGAARDEAARLAARVRELEAAAAAQLQEAASKKAEPAEQVKRWRRGAGWSSRRPARRAGTCRACARSWSRCAQRPPTPPRQGARGRPRVYCSRPAQVADASPPVASAGAAGAGAAKRKARAAGAATAPAPSPPAAKVQAATEAAPSSAFIPVDMAGAADEIDAKQTEAEPEAESRPAVPVRRRQEALVMPAPAWRAGGGGFVATDEDDEVRDVVRMAAAAAEPARDELVAALRAAREEATEAAVSAPGAAHAVRA
jgi:hypothetical protein